MYQNKKSENASSVLDERFRKIDLNITLKEYKALKEYALKVRLESFINSTEFEVSHDDFKKKAEIIEARTAMIRQAAITNLSTHEIKPKHKDAPTFAYVTNGIDPFWDLCAAGVRIAEKEFGVQCEVLMPPKGVVDQKRMMEAMLAKGVDGVAVSPIDAENQTPFLNEVGQNTILITQDADAPKSDRLVYIGTNNYKAGRALGGLVKKAIPEGGEVMIFVGRLEQLNARQRRQGVIDELLNRQMQKLDQVKFDPVDASDLKAEGSKYIVLDTRTDNFDKAKAKSNAEDSMTKYKNLKCMVGLFAYNPPACIDAIREANKQNQIKVCGFDEQDATLQAILDGNAHGTISQQPWEYGYESIKMLKSIHEGKQPDDQYFELPFLVVDRSNVEEFWAKKKEMAALGKQQ